MAERTPRPRVEQIRDATMLLVLTLWIIFGLSFVVQIYTSGAKVIDSLPPVYFWGAPIFPFTALYNPWIKGSGHTPTELPPPAVNPPADPPTAPAASPEPPR